MPSYTGEVSSEISIRLDRYIAEELRLLRRSQIKARSLEAKVNGKAVKISRLIKQGDFLELEWKEEAPLFLTPENLPLNVVYEDSRVIVINKEQGMVVHPGAGNKTGTLANALLFRMNEKRRAAGGTETGGINLRPGIVHRLDKDTSGLIIAAWDDEALAFLQNEFKNRRVKKTYAALVSGVPREKTGRIETRIARSPKDRKLFTVSDKGKTALTCYKVIKTWEKKKEKYSLILLRPKTGRTHQLRVHMKFLGCPIIGDPLYGPPSKTTLMLHAKRLEILLPGCETPSVFTTRLPERFLAFTNKV